MTRVRFFFQSDCAEFEVGWSALVTSSMIREAMSGCGFMWLPSDGGGTFVNVMACTRIEIAELV